ncbi:MAG: hypothetical protein HY884_05445 [Deltaproteobacteria bacterium]|nr:hypothetical protein [Deltaproteobacteria bacterium]
MYHDVGSGSSGFGDRYIAARRIEELATEIDVSNTKGGFKMLNWKTTLSGVLAASSYILPLFGVPSPVAQAVGVIGLALLGYFAKDKNVSGGTTIQ